MSKNYKDKGSLHMRVRMGCKFKTGLVELMCAHASCVHECQPKIIQACMAPFEFFVVTVSRFEFKGFVTASQQLLLAVIQFTFFNSILNSRFD